ncbi:MAG TPA: PDZ domain-containing protein [Planctomycetota bacterium]|nr:PDZ domain-containing protein [Planctomycetota bacterium]HNU24547.1 PDZ domain-containing protein [Planctomycetota bacterium]HOE29062.1 PDZ domain-containing protein [Planctomycetota bacterium]HOE85984.1 PDZ domain-containing protein [Planctomycetota bacterium]HOR66880.1 PDZ domain-containing protein [Planctomycetota bacterium]
MTTLGLMGLLSFVPAFGETEARLLRFPAIYEDQLVFTYAGDLYSVSARGGTARKLTNDAGFEMFARFSPDGKLIAFTGQYDGNTEVYVMPATGGVPRRLTYTATLDRDDVADRMGPNNIVMAWTPDGKRVIFRSRMRSFNAFIGRLYSVALTGGLPEELPLPRAGFCSFSPDGGKLAYNRVFREFRTWKRYRGGMADDVWVYDFAAKTTENITNNSAQDIMPMWSGDRIFFLSDRGADKRMNLFAYDTRSKETRQLTDFSQFDVKFPSLGKDAVVFENGGYIYRYDISAGLCAKVDIRIDDDLRGGRGGLVGVADKVTNFEISPDGKRALFGARGDVFTVPAKRGIVRNLTASPGVHERNAKWSPDGQWIAYISDVSGEDEIWVAPQAGGGPARQVTKGEAVYKYRIAWSPDSRKIIWADKALRLRFVNVETGVITEVCQGEKWEFSQYAWSPDSQWIVYAKPEAECLSRIHLYSLKDRTTHELTDGWYDSSNPVFSSDGRFVFFVSDRDFDPIYSRTEWNHAYRDMARIYLITLAKETESPFKPRSDEVEVKAAGDKQAEAAAKQGEAKKDPERPEPIKVDLEGIKDRIAVLPIAVSSYRQLGSAGDLIYYIRDGYKEGKPQLRLYDLKEREETELGRVDGFEISADGKKMLVAAGGRYAIIDLPKSRIELKDTLDLSGLEVDLDKRAEWRQIFHECWRQMRDFFYVPNLHGVDWEAVRARYEPLVAHVNHRADLTYVLGEMIGELNAGHTYVGGGESPAPGRIPLGLLGAELVRDAETGYCRIARILRGENWARSSRSPLTEIGVEVREGDYILAIDGRSTAEVENPYELLVNKADKQVALKVNSKPELEGSRDTIVMPAASEENLYYYAWVRGNIEKVAKATGGKVGYLHVPDMGAPGLNEFVKHFYPQIRKKALIIDVRGNGGGNVSPMLIERLRREIVMIDFARNTIPAPDPEEMIYGPMVCLADEFSASDGDLFTYRFKRHKLGKVIGKRTWGGVIGIRGTLPLLDGGYLNKPEFSRYSVDGKSWIIEGEGVEPDIVVDNDPAQEYAGVDQQLDKAIEVILEELKTKEKTIPPLPPYPVK